MAGPTTATRNWIIAVCVLIAAGVIAYFVGAAMGRSERGRELAAAQAQLAGARAQVASLQSAGQLMTADLWTYRAAVDLDARNFGIADDAAAKATASLGKVDAQGAGIDPARLKAVQAEASGVKIVVATDLQSQRAQLLKLAADIDALVDQSAAKAAAAS